MARFAADAAGLQKRIARSSPKRRAAAREATRALGREIVTAAVQRAPNDTGRYHRALAEAGNNLGGTFLLPPLRESKLSDKVRDRVIGQIERGQKEVERWQRNVRSYEIRGQRKSTKSYRDAVKYLKRWEKYVARAQEYLAELDAAPEGAAIAIGLYGGQRKTKSKNPALLSRLTRVVGTVYGGAGRVFTIGNRSFVEIHNKEPHASIVEKNQRVMRRALNVVKGASSSTRGYGQAYLRRMREAWGKAG